MTQVTLTRVRSSFSGFVRKAEAGEPVVITRYGEPVAAMISMTQMEQFQELSTEPARGLASLAGGWEGSEELVERLAEVRGLEK